MQENTWEYSSLNLVAILILNDFKLINVQRKQIKAKPDNSKIYFLVQGDLDKQREIVIQSRNKEIVGNINKFVEIRENLIRTIKNM